MEGSSPFSRVECVVAFSNSIDVIEFAHSYLLLFFRYMKAKEAKESRKSKHEKSFGPKGGNFQFNENFEKNLYVGLIDHLKSKVS